MSRRDLAAGLRMGTAGARWGARGAKRPSADEDVRGTADGDVRATPTGASALRRQGRPALRRQGRPALRRQGVRDSVVRASVAHRACVPGGAGAADRAYGSCSRPLVAQASPPAVPRTSSSACGRLARRTDGRANPENPRGTEKLRGTAARYFRASSTCLMRLTMSR
jgi:hypothetical protein